MNSDGDVASGSKLLLTVAHESVFRAPYVVLGKNFAADQDRFGIMNQRERLGVRGKPFHTWCCPLSGRPELLSIQIRVNDLGDLDGDDDVIDDEPEA